VIKTTRGGDGSNEDIKYDDDLSIIKKCSIIKKKKIGFIYYFLAYKK
jgi:hypothetical protein